MILYPTFVTVLSDRDVDELAAAAGVPATKIRGIAVGNGASLDVRMRLARALDVNPLDLFRLADDLEAVRDDAEARGYRWYIDDPATLRAIDEPRAS